MFVNITDTILEQSFICYPLYWWIIRKKSHGFVINILFNRIVWEISITKAEGIIKEQIGILSDGKHCVKHYPGFNAEELPVILTVNKSSIISLVYWVLLFQRRKDCSQHTRSLILFLLLMQKFLIPSSYLHAMCKPFLVPLRHHFKSIHFSLEEEPMPSIVLLAT